MQLCLSVVAVLQGTHAAVLSVVAVLQGTHAVVWYSPSTSPRP